MKYNKLSHLSQEKIKEGLAPRRAIVISLFTCSLSALSSDTKKAFTKILQTILKKWGDGRSESETAERVQGIAPMVKNH